MKAARGQPIYVFDYDVPRKRVLQRDGSVHWERQPPRQVMAKCGDCNGVLFDSVYGHVVCCKCGTVRSSVLGEEGVRDSDAMRIDEDDSARVEGVRSKKRKRARDEENEVVRTLERALARDYREAGVSEAPKKQQKVMRVSSSRRRRRTRKQDNTVEVDGVTKSTDFLQTAGKVMAALVKYPFILCDIYDTKEPFRSFMTPALRVKLYEEGMKFPRYVWALLLRPMEAQFYAAAGLYLACLRLHIPATVEHIATCLYGVCSKPGMPRCAAVHWHAVPKIYEFARNMTSTKRFPELAVSYEHGVRFIYMSMARYPEVPAPLKITPRNSSGKPRLTNKEAQLRSMSLEERMKLRPKIPNELFDDFVKECDTVWQTFLRLDSLQLEKARKIQRRALTLNRALTSEETKFIANATELHFKGNARRTKVLPGIKLGMFTPSAERMANAIFVFVVQRYKKSSSKYGVFCWRDFNRRVCMLVRIRRVIRNTLAAYGKINVGRDESFFTTPANKQASPVVATSSGNKVAAAAAAAAIGMVYGNHSSPGSSSSSESDGGDELAFYHKQLSPQSSGVSSASAVLINQGMRARVRFIKTYLEPHSKEREEKRIRAEEERARAILETQESSG